ncbi:hypothetical protein HMPREF0083_05806 [Aneurinibacillus aneurinilyticus ATCC 12856]|uniref:Uncharacterized protein n=1 Tax=Aneurinibacillus aneurinilyticus ATCC 12856 TaxID=649747 RepID=U1XYK8_ANEAE|nr:hypothetical protein HMPREF0083_05806 [Aneurinibacillus aneurinilyticus ATCC 12856]
MEKRRCTRRRVPSSFSSQRRDTAALWRLMCRAGFLTSELNPSE